jgi:hypothetical protein
VRVTRHVGARFVRPRSEVTSLSVLGGQMYWFDGLRTPERCIAFYFVQTRQLSLDHATKGHMT